MHYRLREHIGEVLALLPIIILPALAILCHLVGAT